MKITIFLLLLLGLASNVFSQRNTGSTDTHSFEHIGSLQHKHSRPLVVFISADWCGYCKVMKNKVFKNPSVAQKLAEDFYYTELNGEWPDPIVFSNKTYHFHQTGLGTGTHELATLLGTMEGKLSYPTLVILNADDEILYRYSGYLNSKELLELLSHFEK